jgi:hypothetical protein
MCTLILTGTGKHYISPGSIKILLQLSTIQVHRMPYVGNTLLNPSICVAIKHNSSTQHAIFWQYTFKSFNVCKVYCQNMACGVLELGLIATKIEGFKSVLPTYGMRCT